MPSFKHTDKSFFIKQTGETSVIGRILCQINAMDWMTWIGYLALKVNGVTSQHVHPNSHKYGVAGQRKAIVIPIRKIRGSNV